MTDEDLYRSEANRKRFEAFINRTMPGTNPVFGGSYSVITGHWIYVSPAIQMVWKGWVEKRWDLHPPC